MDKREIRSQALKFYEVIYRKENVLVDNLFKASTGWLYTFMKRKDIGNKRLTGEIQSADQVAAERFLAIFKAIVEERDYHPDAIYIMDECSLFYKAMPKSTFISRSVL